MRGKWGLILLMGNDGGNAGFEAFTEQMKKQIYRTQTLVFDENERFLSRIRAALYSLRTDCRWVCIAARGGMCAPALAVAAQLPVEKLILSESCVFAPCAKKTRAEKKLSRINAFARRNLSLVVSQVVLIDPDADELRHLACLMAHAGICVMDANTAACENLWQNNEF